MISFVVPAFNTSDTIIRCLDSVYDLPIEESEFEVIVIDDCSTDNTVEIVRKYAESHNNLILLCQLENHCVGAARNKGVAIAKGKYIVFVDSDDESAKGVLSAVRLAEENNLDMVSMQYAKVGKCGNYENVCLPFEGNNIVSGMDLQTTYQCSFSVWSYLFRKTFMERLNYPFAEDVLYEDADFVSVHLYHANRTSYCSECGYVYHYNSGSITHTLSYEHLCDYALLGTRMLKFYENLEDKKSKYAKGILDGGNYNIMKAFQKLPRLKSRSAVCSFYDRFDALYDRKRLLGYCEPAFYWNRWTRICLMHRGLASALVLIAFPFCKTWNGMKEFLKRILKK